MPGGSYIALSGMHTRLDQLDRLASDIANANTAGYKMTRTSSAEATRPQFDAVFQSAIDVTTGGRRLDTTVGAVNPTGRDLDVAIEGQGFFVVETAAGMRYTRNGHFSKNAAGLLTTDDGSVVQGKNGPVQLGPLKVGPLKLGQTEGKIVVGEDGTVRVGDSEVGTLAVMTFADPGKLVREGSLLRADDMAPQVPANVAIHGASLEQSNVSVVERIAQLTDVMRSFEALQKAVSLQMNDIDSKAIDVLGRR
jgi:flagellar basal-body rod protein FlgF